MNDLKRIALYGGSFDPVHCGHLEVAARVSEVFEIDRLLFVPAQVAPHKVGRAVTPALHRYAMLALATAATPRLEISALELEASAPAFTVDTLTRFRAGVGTKPDLFFVMGADSWVEITGWHQWERVLTLANHIVVSRPGYDPVSATAVRSMSDRIVDLRGQAPGAIRQAISERAEPRIFLTDVVMMNISATEVRRSAPDRAQLRQQVPPLVADYIDKYQLYRDGNE